MMRYLFCVLLLVAGLPAANAQSIIIQNVNVWDGTSDGLAMNQQVRIDGNLIAEVAENVAVPQDATIIDGKGQTLIPGLSDAHVHLALTIRGDALRNDADWMYVSLRAGIAAENFLKLGFTTVRDLGGPVFGLKQAIDEGLVPGPRIYPSGAFISQTSGHGEFRNPNEEFHHIGVLVKNTHTGSSNISTHGPQ